MRHNNCVILNSYFKTYDFAMRTSASVKLVYLIFFYMHRESTMTQKVHCALMNITMHLLNNMAHFSNATAHFLNTTTHILNNIGYFLNITAHFLHNSAHFFEYNNCELLEYIWVLLE